MEKNKVTKRKSFTEIKTLLQEMGRDDLAEVMAHELELLDKKSTKSPNNKNAKLNAELDERILAVLEDGVARTATTIMSLVDVSDLEGIETLSLPRVTNRLTALGKEAQKVDRIQDKKTVSFRKGTGLGFEKKTTKAENAEE